MTLADFPKLKELPAREKLKLAEELWFDGVSDDTLSVPSWHKELLSQRMAAYKKGELKTLSVSDLKRRLRMK
jgi:putative addiction module component (TIGR02574 family)